jgi:hypothetical protein
MELDAQKNDAARQHCFKKSSTEFTMAENPNPVFNCTSYFFPFNFFNGKQNEEHGLNAFEI